MSQKEKLLTKLLLFENDNNFLFDDLVKILLMIGFEMSVKGSHHIFRKTGFDYKPNLQKDGKSAKPYQVKQIRKMIIENKLWYKDE